MIRVLFASLCLACLLAGCAAYLRLVDLVPIAFVVGAVMGAALAADGPAMRKGPR